MEVDQVDEEGNMEADQDQQPQDEAAVIGENI